MRDHTIDEVLVELARTMKALKALRVARNQRTPWQYYDQHRECASAKRASLDLTRKLADLRAGR